MNGDARACAVWVNIRGRSWERRTGVFDPTPASRSGLHSFMQENDKISWISPECKDILEGPAVIIRRNEMEEEELRRLIQERTIEIVRV